MLFIHKFIPQTLLARFVLIIIIPTLIGQILIIFLFYDRHWYNVSYYTSSIITNEIHSFLEQYNDLDKTKIVGDYLNLSYQFHLGMKLPLKQPKINEELGIFKNILDIKINNKNIVRLNKHGKIEILFQLNTGVVNITFPTKLLINPTSYIFILWLIFLTILLISTSLIFARNQIKSILTLTDVADQFGRGVQVTQIFKPSGAKEIKKAGIAFLKMKARIERQVTKRIEMLAMISHDLRTPLTRMKLQLELMENSEEVEELKQDILTMQQMITSYLDFVKGEEGEGFKLISIISWIKPFLTKWNHINIDLVIMTDKIIKIKPNAFARAISNILSNSIKYATKIKITLHSTTTHLLIDIEDNGCGVQDSEKLLVFNPFYRSEKSRNLDNSGSVGLGLAITKEIILHHNGAILLKDSQELGGLLVQIMLPILKE